MRKVEILDPIIAGDSTITGKADNAGKDGKAGNVGKAGNREFYSIGERTHHRVATSATQFSSRRRSVVVCGLTRVVMLSVFFVPV